MTKKRTFITILFLFITITAITTFIIWKTPYNKSLFKNNEKKQTQENTILFSSCTKSLYSYNPNQYNFWKTKFNNINKDIRAYDAGAYCKLSNGKQLISFSYFTIENNIPGQTITLFDSNNNLEKTTKNFSCNIKEKWIYPVFNGISNNNIHISCQSKNGEKETFTLSLETWQVY